MLLEKNFYTESKWADHRLERGDNDFFLAWIKGKEVLSVEYIPANYPALTVIVSPLGKLKGTLKRLREIGYKKSEKW